MRCIAKKKTPVRAFFMNSGITCLAAGIGEGYYLRTFDSHWPPFQQTSIERHTSVAYWRRSLAGMILP